MGIIFDGGLYMMVIWRLNMDSIIVQWDFI